MPKIVRNCFFFIGHFFNWPMCAIVIIAQLKAETADDYMRAKRKLAKKNKRTRKEV